MPSDPQNLSAEEALEQLKWLQSMGADEPVQELGVDRRQDSAMAGQAPAGFVSPQGGLQGGMPAMAKRTVDKGFETRALAAKAQTLDDLKDILLNFDGSPLKKTATQLVFSDGVAGSKLMLVGEAPGREEDLQGKPFVGRSGKLLDKMLEAIDLDRSKIYISNIVNWRPPGNRTPTPQEMAMFLPFIQRHIALAKPELLLFLGNVSAQTLLGTKEGITKLRGKWAMYSGDGVEIPAMPSLHPAYLLRNPPAKKDAWADLVMVKQRLDSLR